MSGRSRGRIRTVDEVRLDPIVILPYDDAWPITFEVERARLTRPLRAALRRPIEHMGSTSVPGLAAKPIIDMLAVVRQVEDVAAAIPEIQALGWLEAPEPDDERERRLSFCFPSVERRSHHLHVVEEGFDEWRGWLAFRDFLRQDGAAAREYERLKEELAAAHGQNPDEREAYRSGKASFIRELTTQALKSWAAPPLTAEPT